MDNGWITIHRKIADWEWYQDANTFRLFFHLVLMANHEDKKWMGKTIKRGQRITSYESLKNELGISVRSLRTAFDKLIETGEVTKETTNKYTLVTVVNYDFYQSEKKTPTSKVTSKRQATDKPPTTNNNDNNETIKRIWSAYPNKKGKRDSVERYIPKILKTYTEAQILNAIKVYDKSVKDKQYLLHGSTFFNGRYLDYIDNDDKPLIQKIDRTNRVKQRL